MELEEEYCVCDKVWREFFCTEPSVWVEKRDDKLFVMTKAL